MRQILCALSTTVILAQRFGALNINFLIVVRFITVGSAECGFYGNQAVVNIFVIDYMWVLSEVHFK